MTSLGKVFPSSLLICRQRPLNQHSTDKTPGMSTVQNESHSSSALHAWGRQVQEKEECERKAKEMDGVKEE